MVLFFANFVMYSKLLICDQLFELFYTKRANCLGFSTKGRKIIGYRVTVVWD